MIRIALVLLLVLTGLAATGDADTRSRDELIAGIGIFAVSTDRGLLVAEGSQKIGAMESPRPARTDPPRFTDDGRHAFSLARTTGTVGDNDILVIDTVTGVGTVTACRCTAVTPAGAGAVEWFDDQGTLHRTDLGSDPPATRTRQVHLPADVIAPQWPYTVFGNVGTTVFVVGSDSHVFRITEDDEVHGVAGGQPVHSIGLSASWQSDQGQGPTLAFTSNPRGYTCTSQPSVALLDATGDITRTDLSALTGRRTDAAYTFDDLWWGADGVLTLLVSVSSCTKHTAEFGDDRSVWRLVDRRWEFVGSSRISAVRQISSHVRAVVPERVNKDVPLSLQADTSTTQQVDLAATGLATPQVTTIDPDVALSLPGPDCRVEALADEQGFLAGAVVDHLDCRDGFAHARIAGPGKDHPVLRDALYAAAGRWWRMIAYGTGADGRMRSQDLIHFGLDVDITYTRFPDARSAEPQLRDVEVTPFVGTWLRSASTLSINTDGTAAMAYRGGRSASTKYDVRLRFINATRNSALAEVVSSSDPGARPGSWFRFGTGVGEQIYVRKPYDVGDMWCRAGTAKCDY